MENMEVDREWLVLHHLAHVTTCVFSRTEAPTICGYCGRVFSTHKKFIDHRRLHHAFYYISHSGLSTPSLSPSMVELTLSLDKKFVLTKAKAAGRLVCHMCKVAVPSNCEKIKIHYLKCHDATISVWIDYPPPPTRPVTTGDNPATALLSPVVDGIGSGDHHSVMDIDTATADYAPEDCSIGDDVVERDDEPADSWELDTVYSDFSDGVLENGPEDQVVPSSFTLPSSAVPPTENQDEDSTSPLDGHDLASQLAYGSGGRCSSASGFPGSHRLLI